MSKHMSKKEKEKREKIVKGMKKGDGEEFEKRYPGRGKEVMYATATKQAMEEDVVAYYKNILVEFIFRENDPRTKLLRDGSHVIDPRGGFGSGGIISKEELARRDEKEYKERQQRPQFKKGVPRSPEEIAQDNEESSKRWRMVGDEFKQREERAKKAKEELDPNFVGPPSPETQRYVEDIKHAGDVPRRPDPDRPKIVGRPNIIGTSFDEIARNGFGGDARLDVLDVPYFEQGRDARTLLIKKLKISNSRLNRDTLPSYGSGPSGNSKPSSNSNRIFPFKDPRKMKK